MAEDYSIEVVLTRAEVARYNLFHIRWLIILDIIGLGVFLFITYASFSHPDVETRDILSTISIWAAIALAVGLSQPLIIFLQIYVFKSAAINNLMAKRSYSFSDFGIHIDSMGRKAQKRWADIKEIKNAGSILLIFTSPKLAYVIPRRCFDSRYEWGKFMRFVFSRIKGKNKTRP
jgi:hypothetical protein